MKCFVWERIDEITDAYHDAGGLLIIAESLDNAKDLWAAERVRVGHAKRESLPTPDHEWPVEAAPTVIVFPDAGCC